MTFEAMPLSYQLSCSKNITKMTMVSCIKNVFFIMFCLKNPNNKNYTFISICYAFINHYAIRQQCHEFITFVALIVF